MSGYLENIRDRRMLRAWVVVVVVAVVVVLGLTGALLWQHAWARIQFLRLVVNKDDPIRAKSIATVLSRTPDGIHLACNDADVYGGRTKGWASWMLINSTEDEIVESCLRDIIDSPAKDQAKIIEVLWVMWHRTNDRTYLRALFQEVLDPGGYAVAIGRRQLASVIDDKYLQVKIRTSESSAIPLTYDEFSAALDETYPSKNSDGGEHD